MYVIALDSGSLAPIVLGVLSITVLCMCDSGDETTEQVLRHHVCFVILFMPTHPHAYSCMKVRRVDV